MANRAREAHFRALAEFRYEVRRFLNFSESAARAAGVEPHQHQALLALKGLPHGSNATIGVLAERLQLRHHSAVELSDRLQQNGLIRRSRNDVDRREVLLQLTPRGEELLERLSAAHRLELRVAGPKLMKALQSVISHNGRSGSSSSASPARRKQSKKIRGLR